MRSIVASAVTVVLGCGLAFAQAGAPPAQQQQPAVKKMEKKAAKPKMHKLSGVVEAFDATTNKLSVKDSKGAVKDFTLTPEVKITKGGKPATAAEIAAGEKITVATSDDMLKSISLHAAKAKKGPKK